MLGAPWGGGGGGGRGARPRCGGELPPRTIPGPSTATRPAPAPAPAPLPEPVPCSCSGGGAEAEGAQAARPAPVRQPGDRAAVRREAGPTVSARRVCASDLTYFYLLTSYLPILFGAPALGVEDLTPVVPDSPRVPDSGHGAGLGSPPRSRQTRRGSSALCPSAARWPSWRRGRVVPRGSTGLKNGQRSGLTAHSPDHSSAFGMNTMS